VKRLWTNRVVAARRPIARKPLVESRTSVPLARRTTREPQRCRTLERSEKWAMVSVWRSPTTMSARPARIGATRRAMSAPRYWLSASVLTMMSAPRRRHASRPAHVGRREAAVAREAEHVVDAELRGVLGGAVGAAVVDDEDLDAVDAGELRGRSAKVSPRWSRSFRQGIWMRSFTAAMRPLYHAAGGRGEPGGDLHGGAGGCRRCRRARGRSRRPW
jgi:hypothetical protein